MSSLSSLATRWRRSLHRAWQGHGRLSGLLHCSTRARCSGGSLAACSPLRLAAGCRPRCCGHGAAWADGLCSPRSGRRWTCSHGWCFRAGGSGIAGQGGSGDAQAKRLGVAWAAWPPGRFATTGTAPGVNLRGTQSPAPFSLKAAAYGSTAATPGAIWDPCAAQDWGGHRWHQRTWLEKLVRAWRHIYERQVLHCALSWSAVNLRRTPMQAHGVEAP